MTGKQLKNSILQWAIQGKLVPQDPNDEPASVLLERIRKEKEQLVKEGKLKKKDLATTPIADDEKPFDIPSGWEWCRLDFICKYIEDCPHTTAPDEGHGFPLVRTPNIGFGKLLLKGVHRVSKSVYDLRNSRAVPMPGDLIYAREAPAGNVAVIEDGEMVCLGQRTVLISPFIELINSKCLAYFILSPLVFQKLVGQSTGTTVAHVNLSDIRPLAIPLPPLAEQRRIVAKIEELMPLVEKYGKAQTELDTLNQDLPRRLRQSVLQQAIQGKLVEQDPNDEPASVLLERIRKEKEQLVKEGKLKKKDLIITPIADEEKPFDIPENWEWAKVGNIFQTYSGGTPDKGHPEYYSSNDVKWAKVGDLGSLYLSETEEYISTTGMENSSAKLYPVQTVLVAMYCNDAIGKSSVTKSIMASNQAICGLLPNSNVLPEYLYYVIQYIRPSLIEKSAGGAQKNINQKIVNDIVFPLPPLAEQRRIVAKIEKLFAEIDKLK